MIRRNVWETCVRWLDRQEIILIVGPRQAGKTTLLREISAYLEAEGEETYYFSLENPLFLESLNGNPENIFSYIPKNDRRKFLLLDEIQYLMKPSQFLKYLYDTYGNQLKFIVSGSSAFYIDRSFTDSMAGRKRIIELFPFSFSEFLIAKEEPGLADSIAGPNWLETHQKRHLLIPEKEKLYGYLSEYLLYGGYPSVVMEDEDEEKRFILRDLHESFLKKDMLEAGVSRQFDFYRLVKIISDQPGSLFNANEIANTLGIAAETVREYIYLLRKSFIAGELSPFHANVRKELTKMPKLYLMDNGFRNIVINDFRPLPDRLDRGELLENQLFVSLRTKGIDPFYFWRTQNKHEVDFVLPGICALEVKWTASRFNFKKYSVFSTAYPSMPLYPVAFRDDESPDLLDFLF